MAPPSTRAPFFWYQQSPGAKSVISMLVLEWEVHPRQGGPWQVISTCSRALCELQFHIALSWAVTGNKCQLLASGFILLLFFLLFLFASHSFFIFIHAFSHRIQWIAPVVQLSSQSSPSPEISTLMADFRKDWTVMIMNNHLTLFWENAWNKNKNEKEEKVG